MTARAVREASAVSGPRVVTAAHPAAASAGVAAFAAGGNAFDAALAACFVETVALPMKCGLAGDVVALFRRAGGRLQAMISVGPGPAALAAGASLQRLGPASVGIPGAPDGYATLYGFATLPLRLLVGAGVRAANAGTAWTRVGLSYVHEAAELLRQYNADTPYMPDGRIPNEGDLLRLPGLGALLERFADRGAALFDPDGPDGHRLLTRLAEAGGILRAEDLRLRPARVAEPVRLEVGGVTLYGTPAPSGGSRLLALVHEVIQGAEAVQAVRAERVEAKRTGRLAQDGGTSVVTAADEAGNAVVVVHSNSFPRFGSGVVLSDGLVLNNRPGRGFDLSAPPGSPAAPLAGRTPPTTLHAWAVQRPAGLVMGATPGGINQLPWNVQAVTELLGGADPVDLVYNPRWALNEADELAVEPGAAAPPGAANRKDVPALSHRSVQQVLDLPAAGLLRAAADPRVAARALPAY